jgi:hypothetical protein
LDGDTFYSNRKHADDVQAKIENDENMKPICGQFGDLMSPNSEGIMEFQSYLNLEILL